MRQQRRGTILLLVHPLLTLPLSSGASLPLPRYNYVPSHFRETGAEITSEIDMTRSLTQLSALLTLSLLFAGCSSNYTPRGGTQPVVPSITTQPANQSVNSGQTATFSVVATGTAPLTYQWQKNNSNISGATSSTYTTPATGQPENGATFRAIVTNSAGNATSNSATLTVNAAAVAPSITTPPANQTVNVGQTATFSVVAMGTAPLSYQWQKNNANISGATASSYTTPATVQSDNGSTFRVVVTNSAGNTTSSAATLTVNTAPVAPTITTQPANQTVTVR